MGSLLKRLCDFEETGPAARAALDVVEARSVGRYSLLLPILGSLSKGQTDPVQVLVSSVGRDAGMEPAAAALKALEGHPVLAELPAEQTLYPTTKWTVCRVLLDGKAQPGVRALEDVYWGREAAEDLKPVAEIFLRRQGNELGLAMIAGWTPVDREEIAGLKQQLAEASKQDQRSGWTEEKSARITDRSAVLAAIDAGLSRLEVKRLVSAERSTLVDETPTSVASRIKKRS